MRSPHLSRLALVMAFAAALATAAAVGSPATARAASIDCASTGSTPSRAVQDACDDHAMGSSLLTAAAPAAPVSGPRLRSLAATPAASASPSGSLIKGFDVSGYQGANPDFTGLAAKGYKFVFIKANEATGVYNDYFTQQWVDAGAAGLIRGVYDFARPDLDSGPTEAQAFYTNGASLAAGAAGTLPPVVDLEQPAAGKPDCSNLSQSGMVSWISSYISTLTGLTGRQPLIYSNAGWWSECTGNTTAFVGTAKLWIANWVSGVTSPAPFPGWASWTFWQYSDALTDNPTGGDVDVFNSTALSDLVATARYDRIAGPDRFASSVEASETFSPGGTVYLANGENFPDALSAGAAAGKDGAPVLLADTDQITAMVADRLTALKPAKIVVIGGTASISDTLKSSLTQYTQSGNSSSVVRESGADRFDTSAAVAQASFAPGVGTVYIASGMTFPDALSASAAAAAPSTAGPLLLVTPDLIPQSVRDVLTQLQPRSITVVGGSAAISEDVYEQLSALTTGAVTRLAGDDRFGTGEQIVTTEFRPGVPIAYVASGLNFPDALVGAPLAALSGSPVLMATPTAVPGATADALTALRPQKIIVLGGANSISPQVQAQLQSYVAG
ncbi:cell wall-binding repeat-containing protein [Gryllotalpicola protaetiae]|uniref:cell wall-binding repeat-containing protein n=1 Tax=Gryllotalpicola protaetiae TaxID=2419771 RepID=UPI0013C4A9B0|nr:cell wall-binding repeat-containing protein [Gryllotalpicola protaetiae]